MISTRILLAALLVLLACSNIATAQTPLTEEPEFLRFGCGDLKYRGGAIYSKVDNHAQNILFYPDEGWTCDIFLARHDFQKGWINRANEWGFNGFGFSMVATGHTEIPPSDDLFVLSEKNVYAAYQIAMASQPMLSVSHGIGSAMAIKARTFDEKVCKLLVLIDPVLPPGIVEKPDLDFAAVRERQEETRERLHRLYGIGKRDSDIGEEGFERLMERYESEQPSYWASIYTGFEGGMEVRDASKLAGLPVLIVGTPHRDRDQRNNEDALEEWLLERGCSVERLELADLDLDGVGGLPMAGDNSDSVLDEIIRWAQRSLPPTTGPTDGK